LPDLNARTVVRYLFSHKGIGRDGREWDFGEMDDSFRAWRAIVRWNLHYRHWGALRMNARDLFSKVLWRKIWRPS
jgi:hypothetical protein